MARGTITGLSDAEREARDRAYDRARIRTDNHGWDFKTVGNVMFAAGVEYARGESTRKRCKTDDLGESTRKRCKTDDLPPGTSSL